MIFWLQPCSGADVVGVGRSGLKEEGAFRSGCRSGRETEVYPLHPAQLALRTRLASVTDMSFTFSRCTAAYKTAIHPDMDGGLHRARADTDEEARSQSAQAGLHSQPHSFEHHLDARLPLIATNFRPFRLQ